MYKIGNIVANKKHLTIGIVRDIFDFGEVRTDADGVVSVLDLEIFEENKHLNFAIAPSTKKEIENTLILK